MTDLSQNDRFLIGHLQKEGPKSVAELAKWMAVTENAVRQRLTRLNALGLISRVEEKLSRGRPVHKYSVTREGRESAGQNFSDLAAVVWDEVRSIEDEQTRSQVVRGIAKRLAEKYKEEMESSLTKDVQTLSPREKADNIARFFESRGIPVSVDAPAESSDSNPFPILKLHGCPYPGLSDQDELICEMEQSMFSELAGCDIELHRCSRDSETACCTFQPESVEKESFANATDDPQS